MVLVDTSVWVAHLRSGHNTLISLLDEGLVLCHPFVIGELACGNLKSRSRILELLQALPAAPLATHEEALQLLDLRGLAGAGLGYIDIHLLASALLASSPIWTLDRNLRKAAIKLGAAWRGPEPAKRGG